MRATTPTTIRDSLSTAGKRADVRWDGLIAYLVSMLRIERDGIFEIGKLMARRAADDIDRILTYANAARAVSTDITPRSIDPNRVIQHASLVRKLSMFPAPEVVESIDERGRALAADMLAAGTPDESLLEFCAKVEDSLKAWDDLVEVVRGMFDLLSNFEKLAPVDIPVLAHRVANLMTAAAVAIEDGRRREAVDAVLLSTVLSRMMRQPLERTEIVGEFPYVPEGPCIPARRTGTNSGPFRVVAGQSNQLSVLTGPNQSEVITIPNAPSETTIYLAPTAVDGLYHFDAPAGQYTIEMHANVRNVGAPMTLTFNLVPSQIFPNERTLSPAMVAQAINAYSAITGMVAMVASVPNALYLKRVEIACCGQAPGAAGPVSGPRGWVVFENPSHPELAKLGFPSLVETSQSMSAAELATVFSSLGKSVTSSSERVEVYKATNGYLYDSQGAGIGTGVIITKGTALVTVDGNTVTLGQAISDTPQPKVGDECLLFDAGLNSSRHTILTVTDRSFTVDGTPIPGAMAATINPVLPELGVDAFTLRVGTRHYRFTRSDWKLPSNPLMLGMRYVEFGTFGPHELGPFPIAIFQELVHVDSRDSTTSSYLQVAPTPLANELGYGEEKAWATASRMTGNFRPATTFHSQIFPNDEVVVTWPIEQPVIIIEGPPEQGNQIDQGNQIEQTVSVTSRVVRVERGVLHVSPGITPPLFTGTWGPATVTVRNATLLDWNVLLASLVLPDFDRERAAFLLNEIRTSANYALVDELGSLYSGMMGALANLSPALRAFSERQTHATATASCLRSVKSLNAWAFYDQLTKGRLEIIEDDPRKASLEGKVAGESSALGRTIQLDLMPLERMMLTAVPIDGR